MLSSSLRKENAYHLARVIGVGHARSLAHRRAYSDPGGARRAGGFRVAFHYGPARDRLREAVRDKDERQALDRAMWYDDPEAIHESIKYLAHVRSAQNESGSDQPL